MTAPTPPRGTVTTLRAPPKALLVGVRGSFHEIRNRRLVEQHYLPLVAEDAEGALKLLRSAKHEVVILDVDVPGIGSTRFLESLRAEPELADTPVLVVSATDDIDAIERCLAAGADDFLPRTFGSAILKTRLNAAVDRRRLQDNAALRSEMMVARNIQRDFLPESLPTIRGVEIDAALHPARQVSGDFYDAFQLSPSGNLMLVVGDVCDKGVGAALFMALFRSLIRASADPVGGGAISMIGGRRTLVLQSLESATPADMLVRVAGFTNNYIARLHGRTNMFATVFMAVLDPSYGYCTYVNAGHEPALVVAPDGSVKELRPTGPALGMMPDVPFTAVDFTLERGHTLFAFTDGLAEARSPSGEVFGPDRVREMVRGAGGAPATALVQRVVETLHGFSRQAEPHDDLTLLAATRLGRQ
ncbi:MAG: PP2C family protein-serine/threonine phosphatase [Gemmatimonadaceae bacterium]